MIDSRRSGYALLILIVALVAGLAGSANSADAIHHQESFRPYLARVYFDSNAKDGTDASFEILKNGRRVYVQTAKNRGEKFFIGTMYKEDPDASIVKMGNDITGEGQPDLVISEWSGGANCCLTLSIFEIGPTFKKFGTIDAEFGDSGPHFIPDKSSKTKSLAILLYDWTFANWNTDFGDSPAPKVMLRFIDGAYRVAPDLMRASLPNDLQATAASVRNYDGSKKGGAWPDADVSPQLWGRMLDLIYSGHADKAWKFLDAAWPPNLKGKDAFGLDFRSQLAKSPYWPAIKVMNAKTSS